MGRITRATTIANSNVNTARRKPTSPRRSLLPKAHAQTVAGVPVTTEHIVTKSTTKTRSPKPQIKSKKEPRTKGPFPVNPQGKYGTIHSTETQMRDEKWGQFTFKINKTGKPHGRNVKIRTSSRRDGLGKSTVISKYTDLDTEKYTREQTPLGNFAQGISNQAQDIPGGLHGLATGQDYEHKSILNKSINHAFAGDWDSAGKVISDNPYRFAGNVVTEAGFAIIPFGAIARGAGIAGKVGSAVSKVSKGLGKAKTQRKLMTARKKDNTRQFKERGYVTGRESRTGVIPRSEGLKALTPNKKASQFAGVIDGRKFPYSIKSGDETLGWFKSESEALKALKTSKKSRFFTSKTTKKPRPAVYDRYGNNIEDSIHYF